MEFTYGAYDSAGQVTKSVPLYAHGTVDGTCQLLRFKAAEYLKQIDIAVDSSTSTINRVVLTKLSRDDPAVFAQVTVGALRPRSDRSTTTALPEEADAQYKTLGIISTSVGGRLTGFKWVTMDATAYHAAKSLVDTRTQDYDAAVTAKSSAETAYSDA